MTNIKLCGLSREADVLAANECKPHYIGFVFAKASRRYVSAERIGEIFMNEPSDAAGLRVRSALGGVLQFLSTRFPIDS